MQGDFSRDSFDPVRGYTRVLQQQGRVSLDADANEMQAIQLRLLRTALTDIIGEHGGTPDAFRISPAGEGNLQIGPGHYYVAGRLCENAASVLYAAGGDGGAQPWLPTPPEPLPPLPPLVADTPTLAYLDVWERHVSANQADALREVALGGPDTASRAQMVWQVKLTTQPAPATAAPSPEPKNPTGAPKPTPKDGPSAAEVDAFVAAALAELRAPSGRLIARAADPAAADDSTPCLVSPKARYRGLENQLYRVEIRRGGEASVAVAEADTRSKAKAGAKPATARIDSGANGPSGGATFVWSRENASVTFAVAEIAGARVRLREGWRDARFALSIGDWVEVADDVSELTGRTDDLRQVKAWDADEATLTLDATPFINTDDPARRVIVRLWNHAARPGNPAAPSLADDNALRLVEGTRLALEDGITVEFAAPDGGGAGRYRTGDYWLIAARAATADIVWPRDANGEALPLPPHGIDHVYAPLAVFGADKNGSRDLRKTLKPLAS